MPRPTFAALIAGASLAFCVGTIALPGQAQQLSDEELLQLFTQQRDAIKAAQGGGGAAPLTRGLGIGKDAGGQTRGVTLQQLDAVAAPTMMTANPVAPDAGGDANGTAVATAGDDVVVVKPTETLRPLLPDAVATAGGTAAPLPAGAAPTVDGAAPAALTPPAAGDATVQTAAADAQAGGAAPGALAAPGTVVAVLPADMMVNLQIRFGFDSAVLTDDQKPALAQMCRVMKVSDIKHFRIAGHTDAKGSDAYNLRLSQLRAEEVMRYLVRDCGIAADRLEALGLGKSLPLNAADPLAAENRRVEFQALS
jgi:outer membrane protein OmpA-like peptidoglycan-associated protein